LAGDAIGSLGPVAIPTLIAALQDSNDTLRRSAAYALERIEVHTSLAGMQPEFADSFRQASSKSLFAAIHADDPFVRKHAVRMFAFMDIASIMPAARPQLIRLLKDDNVQVRRYASAALRKMQVSSPIPPTTASENHP
jgi:HEAT repeat protein